jgi:hypothetical protein
VTILKGNGTGGFSYVTRYDLSRDPTSRAVSDTFGDGTTDLLVGLRRGYVELLIGYADGTFTFGRSLGVTGGTNHVTVAELTASGYSDIIAAASTNHQGFFDVLLGAGSGVSMMPGDTVCPFRRMTWRLGPWPAASPISP